MDEPFEFKEGPSMDILIALKKSQEGPAGKGGKLARQRKREGNASFKDETNL